MLYVVPLFAVFFKVHLLPFTKIPSQNDKSQNDSLHKSKETERISEYALFALKLSKTTLRKTVKLLVFANYPAVNRGGVSREGSVAVDVAVTNM